MQGGFRNILAYDYVSKREGLNHFTFIIFQRELKYVIVKVSVKLIDKFVKFALVKLGMFYQIFR